MKLLGLELSKLDVNMFSAVNNSLINDGCRIVPRPSDSSV